jgi:hypothetical protein
LRTDVMYTEKGPGHEYSVNPIQTNVHEVEIL